MLTRNTIHFYYNIKKAEFYVRFSWYFQEKCRPKVRSFAGKAKNCIKFLKKLKGSVGVEPRTPVWELSVFTTIPPILDGITLQN